MRTALAPTYLKPPGESATLQLYVDSLFVMKSPGTEDAMVATPRLLSGNI
jgi:hypothetical protein